MNIIFHENAKQFHLFNSKISYIFGVLGNGNLGHIYYGKKVHDADYYPIPGSIGTKPMMCSPADDENFTIELCKYEYPDFGTGDFRTPAYEIKQENGSRVTKFDYDSYKIVDGKPGIEGLPATYANTDDEAKTLIVTLKDAVTGVVMNLYYTIFRDYPVITRHTQFINEGSETVDITKAMSTCLDLLDQDYEWMHFQGAWGRERFPVTRPITGGRVSVESMRGVSSSNFNPFVILKRPNTDENQGEAIGVHLVYSGNFVAFAEGDSFEKTRFAIGINDRWFDWPLAPGEAFDTPEAVMTFTESGLNDLSINIHNLFNNNLVRGKYKNTPRPILLNNWEATNMDFDEEAILKIASKGKEAGVELFVLDDGWFGARDDDYAGLGDWYSNDKLPEGVKGIVKKVNAMGLDMGIWIEPEMVNEDSDLYRAHPDWVLSAPGRDRTLGRHQMVLDFSRVEVVDAIYDMLYKEFKDSGLKYIKWDMNRSLTEVFSLAEKPEKQGTIYHRYVLGVYRLYEKLTTEFPEILFESCSSGGSRFDAGLLYYAPQAWCSDDTDGHERIKIQYGTSYGYPIVSIGAHVSAVPNQQTGRNVSIDTRASVAYFGTFGYELDLNELPEEEFEIVKKQIEFMKKYRATIQFGDFYRLYSPFETDSFNTAAWMSVSKDKKQAVVAIYKIYTAVNGGYTKVKLSGLDPDALYKDAEGNEYYGDYLMNVGIDVQDSDREWYFDVGDDRAKVIVLNS